jgi:hypothetical protein
MQQKDTVAAMHPEYMDAYDNREIYLDVCEGTLRLREKRNRYLPQFPAETDADYEYRADTATCFNLTKKTRDVMTGMVFKDIVDLRDDVNDDIVDLWENIDNAGTHGDVFVRKAFEHAFEGYAVICVEAPKEKAESLEQQIRLGLRPYWVLYKAEDVWNWRYEINPVSKRKELSLIVFREIVQIPSGEFTTDEAIRFRVFRYINGMVSWQLYQQNLDKNNQLSFDLMDEGDLPELSQIPVAIINELGNDPFLIDIALKNIEHFQTYSDYKSLIHKTCVPIPVGKGMEIADSKEVFVGGSTMVQTSAQGDFGFAEVTGSSLNIVRQTLQDNREEAALMGLSLLTGQPQVMMTATEILMNTISETAELRVFARSLQDAVELALGHTAEYLSLDRDEGGSIELRTAWSQADSAFKVSLDELNLRAEIANKLEGVMSQQWLIKFLGVESEDEMNEIMEQLRSEDVVILDDRSALTTQIPPMEEEVYAEEEEAQNQEEEVR